VDSSAAGTFQKRGGAAAAGAPGEQQQAEQLEKKSLAAAPELDRELAQCLQHLGKRDAITRLKALQVNGRVCSLTYIFCKHNLSLHARVNSWGPVSFCLAAMIQFTSTQTCLPCSAKCEPYT